MRLPHIVKIVAMGQCVRCGHCCRRSPPVTKDEAVCIAKRMGLSSEDFQTRYLDYDTNESFWMIKRTGPLEESVCVFLEAHRDGKLINGRRYQSSCRIHDIKPMICRVQFCGLTKPLRKQFYETMKAFFGDNPDYHWK